jgi:hypothetical protein
VKILKGQFAGHQARVLRVPFGTSGAKWTYDTAPGPEEQSGHAIVQLDDGAEFRAKLENIERLEPQA